MGNNLGRNSGSATKNSEGRSRKKSFIRRRSRRNKGTGGNNGSTRSPCAGNSRVFLNTQDVSLYRKGRNGLVSDFYKAGTEFIECGDKHISDWWCMLPRNILGKIGIGYLNGYASRYNFCPKNYELPEEIYPWYFGKISRKTAEELLSAEKLSIGTYLVRLSERAFQETKMMRFVLSIKIFDEKDDKFVVKNYIIHRENEKQNTGAFFLQSRLTFSNIDELLENYRQTSQKFLPIHLTYICSPTTPDTDPIFIRELDLQANAEIWNIPEDEVVEKKELGSGNFGVVLLGLWRGQLEVAIKTIKTSKKEKSKEYEMEKKWFSLEMETMKKLNHPNLVKLFGVIPTKMAIIQEFCEMGDLSNYLKNKTATPSMPDQKVELPDLEQLVDWCVEICKGMEYLHRMNIIHRDLAARNVLLNRFLTAKVADFGLSKEDQSTENEAIVMIPIFWSSPEVLANNKFGKESDIWAFGVTMWEIFSFGSRPNKGGFTKDNILTKLQRGNRLPKPNLSLYIQVAPEDIERVYSVMAECWKESERPTFKQLLSRMMNREKSAEEEVPSVKPIANQEDSENIYS